MVDIDKVRRESIKAVEEAGSYVKKNLTKSKKITFKAKSDIDTEIDYIAEEIITRRIRREFTDHSILSEGLELLDSKSKYLWIIDPIDGSINYWKGLPLFRIGMCLLENKTPIFTINIDPITKDLFLATKGGGSQLNGESITVNNTNSLEVSVVASHISSKLPVRKRLFDRLEKIFSQVMQIRFLGSAHTAIDFVAEGKLEAFFELQTPAWDILPGALLVEEAGGKVTEINGKKITPESTSVLATNGKIHKQMLKLLEGI